MVLLAICPGTHGVVFASHTWLFCPVYPSLFMFPSMSKSRVSRQLAVSTCPVQQHVCSSAALPACPGAEAVPEPPTATALCKHLHTITCDQRQAHPALHPCWTHPERMWLVPFYNYFGKYLFSMEQEVNRDREQHISYCLACDVRPCKMPKSVKISGTFSVDFTWALD